MKKSSNDIVRSLFLMAAMIIIGAGSAFAQSENDYFSLTKNAGTESERTSYYTTFAGAVGAADDGDKITLLKDYTISPDYMTTDIYGVSINKSITLDLNDHTIKRNTKEIDEYRGALISIDGATLTLVDNGADKGTMGSIENIEEYIGHAIVVGDGSKLIAKGVLTSSNRETVHIDDGGTAVIDDCVIRGDGGITLYGTATITNSDISAGNKGPIQVGDYFKEWGGSLHIHKGHLTIGDGVYISAYNTPPYIDYVFGTVIFKALPTLGQNRPTTSSTTRAKTRIPEYYDIAMKSGLSLTFEEGTFQTPEQPMSIKIFDNDGPVDPATYTNPITTNYSKYVKDGGEVIDPNKVFILAEDKEPDERFDRGFRLDAAGEVIFNHAAVTVTSYSGTSTPTTTPYYDFSEAIAAANSGYKTASETGSTEFIPTLKMLDDVSIDTGVEIGDGSTVTKVTLDLNDHELKGNCDAGTIIVKGKATLNLVDTGTDNSKGVVWNSKNETGTNCIYVWDDGELTATGVSIKSDMGTALLNNGSTTVGEGVSFSGNREASIYNHQGTLTLTAWPTFGGSETEGYADIKLYSGRAVTFGGTGLGTPTQKVTLRMVDSSDSDVDAATYTYAITDGYGAKVTDANGPIDPNEVFEWYKESDCVEFYFNGTESTITVRYKITYNGVDGATFETANPTTYTVESDAITLNNPTRNGYVFVGWYDNENFTGDAITTIAKGSTGDKTFYARWKIITAISVQNTSLELKVLDEVATGATLTNVVSSTAVTDENVTLTYTSSNSNVAKVEGGNIICLAAGTATITVSFAGNDKYAAAENKTMNVTVSLNDASVSVDDNAFDLLVGETHTIAATTTPEGLDVTYTADESGVVSVDENGVVTALKDGTATVTVSVGGDGVYAENSTTVTVTVSSYEMADLFSGSNQWTGYVAGRNLGVPAGLTAYIVTALGAETATATEIAYIPQGEPVLLRRSDKTVNSYASFIYTGSASTPDGNLLKAATATSQPTAYRDFVLYQDAFVLVGEGTLATGKVYLPAPQASQSRDASRSIVVDGDDTTGMSEELRVKGEESDGDWYNLQGRRLGGKPTKKGLYIHNNKMEVVR